MFELNSAQGKARRLQSCRSAGLHVGRGAEDVAEKQKARLLFLDAFDGLCKLYNNSAKSGFIVNFASVRDGFLRKRMHSFENRVQDLKVCLGLKILYIYTKTI